MSPVTAVLGPSGAEKTCSCGSRYKPRQANQGYCSKRCYDLAYNRAHPVARQKLLFPPGPVRKLDEPPRDQAGRLTAACARILGRLLRDRRKAQRGSVI